MHRFKKFTPYIIAIVSFILLSAIYFAPQYEGKDVRKGDDIQATGMTGGIIEHIEEYGEHPQWAPNMFSGMPAYLINMNYDGRYIKDVSEYFYFLGTPAAYYFLLMAGFFFMLLCFGVNAYLAIVGALAFGFSSYFVIIYEAGHITKLMALIYIAPLIGSIYLAYKRNLLLGASLAGIFAAIEISCSHPQITYYFLFVIFALLAFEGYNHYKEGILVRFWKRTAVLALVAVFAVGANSVQLWYINTYAKDSIRGKSELTVSDNAHNHTSGLDKDYIVAWSYGKAETLNLFIPNLVGGSSSGGFSADGAVAESLEPYQASDLATVLPAYWGPQPFTSGPVYIGAVMIFLFVLGLFVVKGWVKKWLVAVTIFSIVLAWGKNIMWLTDILIDYMPLYNKFRTVSMILVIAQWSIPLLGLLALQKVWDKGISKEAFRSAMLKALTVCCGVAVVAILASYFLDFSSAGDSSMGLPDDVISAMHQERAQLLRMDAFRSIIFVLLAAGVTFLIYNDKLGKRKLATVVLALVTAADLIGVDMRYLNHDDFVSTAKAKEIVASAVDKEILKDTDVNYRVANLTTNPFNDAQTSYFHKSIGGYHAAKMRRYQDMIDKYLSTMNMGVYNMLNTKYFIVADDSGAPGIQYNRNAFGHAWFVDEIVYADNADQEIALVGEIDLATRAVVDDRFADVVGRSFFESDSTRSVELTSYKTNELIYTVKSIEDVAVVFPEIYYSKGWTAYVDGEEYPYFRANYILRAIVLNGGDHEVVFKFEAPNFALLKAITAGSSIILILMFIISIVLKRRRCCLAQQNTQEVA